MVQWIGPQYRIVAFLVILTFGIVICVIGACAIIRAKKIMLNNVPIYIVSVTCSIRIVIVRIYIIFHCL